MNDDRADEAAGSGARTRDVTTPRGFILRKSRETQETSRREAAAGGRGRGRRGGAGGGALLE